MERVLAWKGPDPVRVDAAQVTLRPDSLTVRGTSAVADYAVDWVLDTGTAWARTAAGTEVTSCSPGRRRRCSPPRARSRASTCGVAMPAT